MLSVFRRKLNDQLVLPVLVNLLTALIIFTCVAIFKEPIYALLGPEPVERYPVYSVSEPYSDEGTGLLKSDLFIINLTGEELSENNLEEFLQEPGEPEESLARMPDIRIRWNDDLGEGNITSIVEDADFNQGKGRLEIHEPTTDTAEWSIRIRELRPKAIMKIVVSTDHSLAGVGRTSKFFSPIVIDYPGE